MRSSRGNVTGRSRSTATGERQTSENEDNMFRYHHGSCLKREFLGQTGINIGEIRAY